MVSSSSSSSRVLPIGDGASADLCSYKLIGSYYPMEMEYERETILCFCKLKSPRLCTWTDLNPGRRFYGCQQYPHDEIFPLKAVEIINELRRREKYLYQQARQACREVLNSENMLKLENKRLRSELEFMKFNSNRSRSRTTTSFGYISLWFAVICLAIWVALVIIV